LIIFKKIFLYAASNASIAVAALLLFPYYLSSLGVDAYNILGLLLLVVGWLAFIDLGISAYIQKSINDETTIFPVKTIRLFDATNFFISIILALIVLSYVLVWYQAVNLTFLHAILISLLVPIKALQTVSRATLMALMNYEFLAVTSLFFNLLKLALPILVYEVTQVQQVFDVVILSFLLVHVIETVIYRHKSRTMLLDRQGHAICSDTKTFASHFRACLPLGLMGLLWSFATQIERTIIYTSTNIDFLIFYNFAIQVISGLNLLFGSLLAVVLSYFLTLESSKFYGNFKKLLIFSISSAICVFSILLLLFKIFTGNQNSYYQIIESHQAAFLWMIGGVLVQFINSFSYILILKNSLHRIGSVVNIFTLVVMLFFSYFLFNNPGALIKVWPVLNLCIFVSVMPLLLRASRSKN